MPQLAQLATDSHLVAFLAINLFNSAIVMAVLALSDPLSDRAQQVKRTLTRILRLQELLGRKTQLSVQSNNVLKDVIYMLLRRETDAMLAPIVVQDRSTNANEASVPNEHTANLMSVEETLRLPIHLPMTAPQSQDVRRQHSTAARAMRLNESLTSVQQGMLLYGQFSKKLKPPADHPRYAAFPTGFDDACGVASRASQDRTQGHGLTGSAHQSSVSDWSQLSLQDLAGNQELGWGDNTTVDATSNGLYWFWDTIWNEPRPEI
jgi:hypothetical protein